MLKESGPPSDFIWASRFCCLVSGAADDVSPLGEEMDASDAAAADEDERLGEIDIDLLKVTRSFDTGRIADEWYGVVKALVFDVTNSSSDAA